MQSATQTIEAREQQRQANGGWLVRPPINPAGFTAAQMIEPKGGNRPTPYPNQALDLMRRWLVDIFESGGTRSDLARAWQSWEPTTRQAKLSIRDVFDQLCLKADAREMELASKLDEETRADRHVSMFKARVAQAEDEVRADRKTLAASLTTLDEARKGLAAVERKQREQRNNAA